MATQKPVNYEKLALAQNVELLNGEIRLVIAACESAPQWSSAARALASQILDNLRSKDAYDESAADNGVQ